MDKKVLVTGGAGFIGANLCRKLLDTGREVICLDNLFSGSIKNIEPLLAHPAFTFIEADVTEPFSFSVQEIYNLACPASPVHYQFDPVKTVNTNVIGMVNVLELARKTGARVLQASTSEVYGDPEVHPQPEDYWGKVNPIGIRSCYDEGKRCAETLCFDYHRQYGTDIKVVRIFNTYGPMMQPNDGRVISNFIMQALEGQDITIYGSGTQTRSFCYVDDLIAGLVMMIDTAPDVTGPVNLGNDNEMTILELAETIIKLTASASRLVFKDLPGDDPLRRRPDLTLARRMLDFEPKTDLASGLKATIDYLRTTCY
ncbi:MAG TPA: SDR family oxidoreductase [Syntrophomonadaceae bacterium]|nr:SDR family oxidoreductase [Syntrophomonadaceae bacterium]HPR92856.1 SDR family oxidoreductase [Syntrophomonadaceae bacterium]